MLSVAGGGAPGPSTGERAVSPPGAESGLGDGAGVLFAMGVPMVGVEAGAGLFCVPVEPTGTVLMVPGASLREGFGWASLPPGSMATPLSIAVWSLLEEVACSVMAPSPKTLLEL